MKRDKELERILDECLEGLLQGRTVEDCLEDYPHYAEELEPLLRLAVSARKATDIRPRAEFKDRARYQFQAAIRDMETETKPHRGFFPGLRPAWIALTALVAVIIAGGGTVYAASGALPDSPLYQIKLATESVRLAFTFSDIGKAELYAEFADERVEEIILMAEAGNADLAQAATERLDDQLAAMASLTGGDKSADGGDVLTFGTAEQHPATVTQPAVSEDAPVAVTASNDEENGGMFSATDRTSAPGEVIPTYTIPPTDDDEGLSREEQLKQELLRQAVENPEALIKALETASEEMREIILWALEVAGEGYSENISNLQ